MFSSDSSQNSKEKMPVGGGIKKVLYTLQTVKRIGLTNATKALGSKNTCKACAYGMGGQQGGMTNELGEFPSVCNKSVQAQSTDIQPPVPEEIFEHTLEELRELTSHELEHLGRLGHPVFKDANSNKYKIVDWNWALDYAARKFSASTPDRSFFYSSGRSSNEAGFILQLIARMYGANNVNNCSYYCHQATSVGLGSTIGAGTATIELEDLTGCDTVFVIGANPSSNHPRFIHMLQGVRKRGGNVIIINPAREPGLVKFAVPKKPGSLLKGGDWIASEYLQPNIGSDIALFKGLAKALIENKAVNHDFIKQHCSDYETFQADIVATPWDDITNHCGVDKREILKVADIYASSENTIFAWGMGMTHHIHGSENVEYIANLALMRGMIGKPNAGLLPLRGHSNVQGIGTIGVKPVLPEDVFQRMENALNIKLPRTEGYDTLGSLKAAHEGNIDTAMLMGGNLYSATPNTIWARQALDRIGFKLYLTTTLNEGHIYGVDNSEALILPVTARDEEWEPTTQESMFNFVRLSDGGINRLENVRPESAILCDLATRMFPDSSVDFESFKQHSKVREAIAKTIPGMEELKDIDIAKKEFHIANRIKHKPEFNTNTGRAQFQIRAIPEKPETSDTQRQQYTLSTVRSEGQFNSIIYEEKDSYRQTETRWCVMISHDDCSKLALKKGDSITICSSNGRMEDVTVYPFDLPPGNVMAYYPEANILTGSDYDPRSKTPAFKSIPVWFEKA